MAYPPFNPANTNVSGSAPLASAYNDVLQSKSPAVQSKAVGALANVQGPTTLVAAPSQSSPVGNQPSSVSSQPPGVTVAGAVGSDPPAFDLQSMLLPIVIIVALAIALEYA